MAEPTETGGSSVKDWQKAMENYRIVGSLYSTLHDHSAINTTSDAPIKKDGEGSSSSAPLTKSLKK